MLQIQESDGKYLIHYDGQHIGTLRLYNNPRHMKNCYVKLELQKLDTDMSAALFCKLCEIANRPLQVMVSSDDTSLVAFLVAGGFQCKRRCYEVESGLEDYIGGQADIPFVHCHAGEADYETACRMMFEHYVATHEAINPWTADYAAFCEDMPTEVICAKQNGKTVAVAFVEGSEIAYVCGTDKQQFANFARCLVTTMLAEYETICFESDDCDWAAMILKSMFVNQDETSFDTYVLR